MFVPACHHNLRLVAPNRWAECVRRLGAKIMIRDLADDESMKPQIQASAVELDVSAPTQRQSGQPMRVVERGVYRGPHLYGDIPMVRIQLDLGALEAWP